MYRTVSFEFTYTHSGQEKEEEKEMPIIVVKDNKTKITMAKVVPNKGVHEYAVEVVRRFVEQLGSNKVIWKSDNEPAILALKEALRRDEPGDCHGGVTCGSSSSKRRCREDGEERAGSTQGVEGCVGEQDQQAS